MIMFEIFCEIRYYKYEHICVFMLIYLVVTFYSQFHKVLPKNILLHRGDMFLWTNICAIFMKLQVIEICFCLILT